MIIIAIPTRWSTFEQFEVDGRKYDLHDQIKAYCAVRGIRTQLLREETPQKRQRAEVLWWLSLATYSKALRTPWLLSGTEPGVAFVGIGYSINRLGAGPPIVLGCSHLFESSGMGMRFRLSHIKDPVMLRRSAYLNRDDAVRIALA